MQSSNNKFFLLCFVLLFCLLFCSCKAKETSLVDSDKSNSIKMSDIKWNAEEIIDDGKRTVCLTYTNNTPYTIVYFDIDFKEKKRVSEEERITFINVAAEKTENLYSEEAMKEKGITIYGCVDTNTPAGMTSRRGRFYYFTSIYYMNEIDFYNLVDPDIATLKYITDGKLYTAYYDFVSKKTTYDEDVRDAYEWGKESILPELIDKPHVEMVTVDMDYDNIFTFSAHGVTQEMFSEYINSCLEKGFVETTNIDDTIVYATKENSCDLMAQYISDKQMMQISLYAK